MTARDDYLELAEFAKQGHAASGDASDALDQIDRLRAQLRTEWTVQEALNELISTLTTHADAMCDLLARVTYSIDLPKLTVEAVDAAIAAYDDFIKEC